MAGRSKNVTLTVGWERPRKRARDATPLARIDSGNARASDGEPRRALARRLARARRSHGFAQSGIRRARGETPAGQARTGRWSWPSSRGNLDAADSDWSTSEKRAQARTDRASRTAPDRRT